MGTYGLDAKGRDVVVVLVVLGCLSIVSTILRVFSRRRNDASLRLDDYSIIAATCLMIVSSTLAILAVTEGGVGLSAEKVSTAGVQFALKIIIACQAIYGVTLALVKSSMLIRYRDFLGTRFTGRLIVYTTGAVIWIWALTIFLESFLICQPINYNWDLSLRNGNCRNRKAALAVTGALDLMTDVMIMALPVSYLWRLHLSAGQKGGLVAIYSLGLCVSAFSITRVASFLCINLENVTYTLAIPLTWTIVEEQLAIVATNMPFLCPSVPPILPEHWPKMSKREFKWPSSQPGARKGSLRAFTFTRMDLGISRSEVTTGGFSVHCQPVQAGRWSDDDLGVQSDTELASNGMPFGTIYMRQEFRVE